jgi:hypothetical protein
MNRPSWQAPAEAAYGALLRFYPREIRERHGEEMKQVFRDRCREVSEGRISAWQLLCLETVPDFATSLAGAHMDHPHTPRVRASLVALALLSLAFLFQDTISARTLDVYFAGKLRWLHWNEQRAFARDEALVRALADRLAASDAEHDRALAAYVYALNSASRSYAATYAAGAGQTLGFEPVTEDAGRSRQVRASLQGGDAETLHLVLAACRVEGDCQRDALARRLAKIEPQNAYGWSELLKVHSRAGNEAAVIGDLQQVGNARYYNEGLPGSREALFATAQRIAGRDAEALAALGRQLMRGALMSADDYHDTLHYKCALPWPGETVMPPWLAQHPQMRASCRHAAVLSAQSRSDWESLWGWRWLDLDHSTPQIRANLEAARHRFQSIPGGTLVGDCYWSWDDDQWLEWAQARIAATTDRT